MGNQINLDNYEPVEERVMRFKEKYPDYRMASEIVDMSGDVGSTRWVVKVTLWRSFEDEKPLAEGHAFEIDGAGMTQRTAALETCETSALGRALANAGFAGNRRVTREEMMKPKIQELTDKAMSCESEDQLKKVWREAQAIHVQDSLSNIIKLRRAQINGTA
ncbi:hypothetical protein [Corynebacterium sp. HMSC28B08]|uniref:hypothetical protein n=1 Tax=Corynebacterium sp. HMSC28B08 TaxID=1581066 RepID=UPI0008A17A71|nr:hypothetical protein [Corynebacterium sp. HMSC28B08]OFT88989.1 hypothetical protein HMPREF3098_06750 [Corynebacterium sp. HMSC28B08]